MNFKELKEEIEHKFEFLKANFKGFQGQSLDKSKIIIFGQDANYRVDFDSLPKITIRQFDLYFNDFDTFIEENSSLIIHTPLLLKEYMTRKKTGSTYHEIFQKISKKAEILSSSKIQAIEIFKSTCFVEILNFPTMPKSDGKRITKAEYDIFLAQDCIKNHIIDTFLAILNSSNKIKVFIPPFVIELITPILKMIGVDEILISWLNDGNNQWKKYKFNKNITFYKIYHFSYRSNTIYNEEGITTVANFILD